MKYLLSIFLFFLGLSAQSQNFLSWKFNDRYFSITVGTGSSSYFGELNYNNKIHDGFSQISSGIEARLLNRLGVRIEGTYFGLRGNDINAPDSSFQKQRNLSFQSKNLQLQLNTIHYIKPYQGDYYRRWIFDPYIISGIGYLHYNPVAELAGEKYSLREAKTEGQEYKKWAVSIPLGVGAKFRINEFANINLEIVYNYSFTDYLDDVSGNFGTDFSTSTAELLSNRKDEIGVVNREIYDQMVPGSRRGNTSNNDGYLLISIKAEFFIPPSLFAKKE